MRPRASDARQAALLGRVRQRGTSAEQAVGAALRSLGLHYRKNVRALPGAPDFANRSKKWAVFVNGCFWHHHRGCKRATIPKNNRSFWLEKFATNRRRDARAIRRLRASGFVVALVWECRASRSAIRLADVLKAGGIEVGDPVDHRSVVVDLSRSGRRSIVVQ